MGNDNSACPRLKCLANEIGVILVDAQQRNDVGTEGPSQQVLSGIILPPAVFVVDAAEIEPAESSQLDDRWAEAANTSAESNLPSGNYLLQLVLLPLHDLLLFHRLKTSSFSSSQRIGLPAKMRISLPSKCMAAEEPKGWQ